MMNRLDFVAAIKDEQGLSIKETRAIVDIFFNEMSNSLASGERVEIRGFCSFYVKKYKAYMGRNPKTGENKRIQPKKLPFFKCGRELKKRVDSR